jgi:Tetracyclin repressor-like, C-terminal domain
VAAEPTHHGDGLAASQLLGLALRRYMLRLEPIASQDPDQLIADIAETIQRRLAGRSHRQWPLTCAGQA